MLGDMDTDIEYTTEEQHIAFPFLDPGTRPVYMDQKPASGDAEPDHRGRRMTEGVVCRI